jgi:uncharacterized membrane protein
MIRFFGKQNKDQLDSTESRLRTVEWKVNLVLAIVGLQLVLTVLMFAKDLLMPSKTSIFVCLVLLVAAGWFFRKQIPGLIRRMIAKQIVGEDSPSRDASRDLEESIK